MTGYDVGFKACHEKGCDQKIKNHAWGRIKADGWFFAQDGNVFCPNHLPEWVPAWRKKGGGK